jgi:hypothetical protein
MGALVCTVQLDKTNGNGITVTIENADANITQTITMNGTTITLKVAGDAATSTITQGAEKVSIHCKQFEVTADETITLKAAQKLAAEGGTEASLTGAGASSLTLAGAGATLKGAPKLSASALEVEVKADAALDLSASGPATLKGAITNVQGNLVNLG